MIYFIQESGRGLIKIGYTENPEDRVAFFRAYIPYELTLLKLIDGDVELEGKIHRQFADLWHRGEWFYPGASLRAYISNLEETKEKIAAQSRWGVSLTEQEMKSFLQNCERNRLAKASIYFRIMLYGRLQPVEFKKITIGELFSSADRCNFPPSLVHDLKEFYAGRSEDEKALDVTDSRLRQLWAEWRPVEGKSLSALMNSEFRDVPSRNWPSDDKDKTPKVS